MESLTHASSDSVLRAMTDDGAFRVITVRMTDTCNRAIVLIDDDALDRSREIEVDLDAVTLLLLRDRDAFAPRKCAETLGLRIDLVIPSLDAPQHEPPLGIRACLGAIRRYLGIVDGSTAVSDTSGDRRATNNLEHDIALALLAHNQRLLR